MEAYGYAIWGLLLSIMMSPSPEPIETSRQQPMQPEDAGEHDAIPDTTCFAPGVVHDAGLRVVRPRFGEITGMQHSGPF